MADIDSLKQLFARLREHSADEDVSAYTETISGEDEEVDTLHLYVLVGDEELPAVIFTQAQ